jgi:IPT/TIG domain
MSHPSKATRTRAAIVAGTIAAAMAITPASWAATPTISSFAPTSGAVGTSVTIHGHNFSGPNVTSVTFNGTSATFTIDNSQKITATVPAGATTGPIAVASPDGTATSSTNFTVTVTGAPTITSFNPTSGPVGTSVRINGSNFTGATAVRFNGVSAAFTVQNATRINATVPSGATTGPISVTTPSGTATSATTFTVTTVTTHDRTITLDLRRHLVARGVVTVNDDFGACASTVPVKIQRLRNGTWQTIDTTQTDAAGTYRERIRDRVGAYRAVAKRVELNNGVDVCVRDRSPRERHTH